MRSPWLLAVSLAACADKGGESGTAPDPTWSVLGEDQPGALLSLWRASDGETWTVGSDAGSGPMLLKLADGAWTAVDAPSSGDLWWVSGTDTHVWIAGEARALQIDRASGEVTEWPFDANVTLYGVWGAGPGDVWAVGGDPAAAGDAAGIWHYDGASWLPSPIPADAAAQVAIYKVWGRSASEVYAVGAGGVILAWDGATWEMETSPTDRNLFTITGDSGGLYASGGAFSGTLLYRAWDGAWADETPDLAPQFNGISARDGCDTAAAGNGGAVYRRSGGAWAEDPRGAVTDLDLHAALVDEDCEIWGVGGFISATPMSQGIIFTSRTDTPEIP